MIHPFTKLQWMVMEREQVRRDTCNRLFSGFADRMENISNNDYEIKFQPGEVKITDWRGWTDLLAIRKRERKVKDNWLTLVLSNQNIVTDRNTLIPTYESLEMIKGFHGASIYKTILKHPYQINPQTDLIRIRRGKDPSGDSIDFSNIMVYMNPINDSFGYELVTKSKFFNANNVHMYYSEESKAYDELEVLR